MENRGKRTVSKCAEAWRADWKGRVFCSVCVVAQQVCVLKEHTACYAHIVKHLPHRNLVTEAAIRRLYQNEEGTQRNGCDAVERLPPRKGARRHENVSFLDFICGPQSDHDAAIPEIA